MASDRVVFITGGTGYIGKRLINRLLKKNYRVIALVRKGSKQKVPPGAEVIVADPFDAKTFEHDIPPGAVFVQLLGVPHPSPKKAQQFREIDLRSVKASADAETLAGVSHFIYVSVAMTPSRLMKAFQQVKKEGEDYCLNKKLNCTFIRPWYVLGPGHWWPLLLLPFYGLAELVPSWRKKAGAFGLVSINQMIRTLVKAAETEPGELRLLEVDAIRRK